MVKRIWYKGRRSSGPAIEIRTSIGASPAGVDASAEKKGVAVRTIMDATRAKNNRIISSLVRGEKKSVWLKHI